MKKLKSYFVTRIEQTLVLAVLFATITINFFVFHKTALLNFYYLPVVIAGYYLGYRKALLQAMLSIVYVAVYLVYSPQSFESASGGVVYLHVAAWSAFLITAGAIVGRLADRLTNEVERRRQAHLATIEALSMALDFRDQSTSGHSRRVADLSTEMARQIGVSQEMVLQIEQGALLHDIGKLKIPDTILWKPEQLTSDEWHVMRQHAEFGYQFLRNMEFLTEAAEIVRCHHEKWDGSGYPRGLAGKDIPIGARVFAIADAYDALVFDRPYRRAVSFEVAAAELRKSAGTHFDPALIEPAVQFLARYHAEKGLGPVPLSGLTASPSLVR